MPNTATAESLKELLESEERIMFTANNEEEVTDLLKNHQVDTILLEPLWGKDFLTEEHGTIKDIEIGGTGLVFFNKIQKDFPNVRTILLTVISQQNILKAGFPKKLIHLRSPISSEVIATTIG